MRRLSLAVLAGALGATAATASGCADDTARIVTVEEPPDAGCLRSGEPQTFQIYFVTDVSGSMEPFLKDLSTELVSFAGGFKPLDAMGRPTRIDFFVVGFVNDVKWYGGRMTSVIAIQAAFDEAIARGMQGLNLNRDTRNAEAEENMLDALQSVIDSNPTAEARLIMLACDEAFVEAPATLSGNVTVKANYASVLEGLRQMNARVHAFVPAQLDGVTREYHGMPALTSLPGSSIHSLQSLTGSSQQIRDTLSFIAREAACN
jgi:hypothetical protein